jgi:hypothetical protein
MPVIRIETLIAAPIEQCFDLARDIDFHTTPLKQQASGLSPAERQD